MAKYTEEQVIELEGKLTQDIMEFVGLFRRKPDEDEVIEWTKGIYHRKHNGIGNGWAKQLIERATNGLNFQQDVYRNVSKSSSFTLYSEEQVRQNENVPSDVLEDLGYHETVGIIDD